MNILKIQTEILKLIDKDKTFSIGYQYYDDVIIVYDNPCQLFIVDIDKWYINMGKIKAPNTALHTLFNAPCQIAHLTNEIKKVEDMNVIKISNKEFSTWVNEKLLNRYIDKYTEINFGVIDTKSPIKVYDQNTLIGMICPVTVKE